MLEILSINNIGPEGPHSSVIFDGNAMVKNRLSDDTLGKFMRWEIDRETTTKDMHDEQGIPLIQTLIDKATQNGNISIIDAGCGTAHCLYKIREKILSRTELSPDKVHTLGIDVNDFSNESGSLNVRRAVKEGEINYVLSDLEQVQLPKQSVDVIYSFEALIHNEPEKIVKIVKNLLPAIKPDGMFIFDLKQSQRDNEQIDDFLKRGDEHGFSAYDYTVEHGKVKRVFTLIRPAQKSN